MRGETLFRDGLFRRAAQASMHGAGMYAGVCRRPSMVSKRNIFHAVFVIGNDKIVIFEKLKEGPLYARRGVGGAFARHPSALRHDGGAAVPLSASLDAYVWVRRP